ncbi:MAG: hypothetical protein HY836_03510 [Aquabacterium sp.]|uniref:LamG-like jellyroll fold domain-containing protein n=1 Tax=Aquabacterium sp. TaxID=1872578 RepID=UPI0025BB2622|nr:LamG-like jellyroll fold domain-containing protein [Aquabacterium sp.]MBI5924641.1 hypothetical protein [Aquabacterium sp.]
MAKNRLTPFHATLSQVALAALTVSVLSTGSASAQSALDYAGQWKLDDCASSAVLADASGNNNDAIRGAFVQCATGWDGQASGAVNFTSATTLEDTANHSLMFGSPAAHKITNQFAFSMRIKPSSTGAGALLTKKWSNPNGVINRTFQFHIEPNTSGNVFPSIRIWFKLADGSISSHGLGLAASIPTNQWTQLGASYDPVNGLQAFMNGKKLTSPKFVLPAGATLLEAPSGTSSNMFVGGKATSQTAGQSFLGAVDDVWFSTGSCTDLQSTRAADKSKELMINAVSVVDDARASGMGPWSFGGLVSQMVPADVNNPQAAIDAAADMVETMFRTWDRSTLINKTSGSTPVVVNGQTLEQRSAIMSQVLSKWPKTANGKLDLSKSPLRLTAIVNRLDLRDLSKGSAGEGRFVFNVLNGTIPQAFTVILEYKLPATTEADIRKWGNDWHKLSASTNYNADLQAVTDRFTKRGALPGAPNGSALNQLRTNEIALGNPWELRQFQLTSGTNGTRLTPAPVAQTPAASLNNNNTVATLGNYLSANTQAILQERHTVPLSLGTPTAPFRGGAAPITDNFMVWKAPNMTVPTGVNAGDVRHKFALNTCSGCHQAETGTNSFLHIGTRSIGAAAPLSGFLTGTTISDPDNGVQRTFNDLQRRQQDMVVVLKCPVPAGTTTLSASSLRVAPMSTSTTTTATPTSTLSKGIGRVH